MTGFAGRFGEAPWKVEFGGIEKGGVSGWNGSTTNPPAEGHATPSHGTTDTPYGPEGRPEDPLIDLLRHGA